jgi:hypothetical protein
VIARAPGDGKPVVLELVVKDDTDAIVSSSPRGNSAPMIMVNFIAFFWARNIRSIFLALTFSFFFFFWVVETVDADSAEYGHEGLQSKP